MWLIYNNNKKFYEWQSKKLSWAHPQAPVHLQVHGDDDVFLSEDVDFGLLGPALDRPAISPHSFCDWNRPTVIVIVWLW